jgi:hypothetical protein
MDKKISVNMFSFLPQPNINWGVIYYSVPSKNTVDRKQVAFKKCWNMT